MEIRKEGGLRGAGAPDEARLAKINAYARTPLTAEAVYCFRVRLCDDRPDRDFERFDTAALPRMAELFRGKTGICDHQWSADRQVARIFDTQVVREDDGASCLMAEAYVLRTERNADLIADIEGGIKKEVSVGCAMGQARCSICGEPYGTCAHRKGAVYDGETCLAVLSEPLDAYEFSFVAVPAQRAAGVTKAGKEGYGMTLQDCVAKHGSPELSDALRRLSAEAELGRAWRKQLEDGLVALGLSLSLPVRPDLLWRPTDIPHQTGLSAAQRRRNAAGSFRAADVRSLHLWLVDDIITTGSTLRAAGAELLRAGAARVDVLALARTPRP